ncbi:hypothetical protein [Cupriavidus nantongensis]|uniref:hypothetical protein n=1 Tax=Cupriavidus nantongensis TaxID=1796606 RepID=UPI0012373D39|nr:hypothetical protein [Cupriavidus nantongensis]
MSVIEIASVRLEVCLAAQNAARKFGTNALARLSGVSRRKIAYLKAGRFQKLSNSACALVLVACRNLEAKQ